MPERSQETRAPRRPNRSFLVRLWRERNPELGAADSLRGFVRDLRTGEELYLASPAEELVPLLAGRIEAESENPADASETA